MRDFILRHRIRRVHYIYSLPVDYLGYGVLRINQNLYEKLIIICVSLNIIKKLKKGVIAEKFSVCP